MAMHIPVLSLPLLLQTPGVDAWGDPIGSDVKLQHELGGVGAEELKFTQTRNGPQNFLFHLPSNSCIAFDHTGAQFLVGTRNWAAVQR